MKIGSEQRRRDRTAVVVGANLDVVTDRDIRQVEYLQVVPVVLVSGARVHGYRDTEHRELSRLDIVNESLDAQLAGRPELDRLGDEYSAGIDGALDLDLSVQGEVAARAMLIKPDWA